MRLYRTALAVSLLVALGGTAFAAAGKGMMSETTSVKVTMNAQHNSKESGTATLTQKGKDVVVTISLSNAKGTQPAHIHPGTCAKLNPSPKYMLSNVVNGKSTTTVKNLDLDELWEHGPFAVNVHKSTKDLKTYVSCGDIKK
jgi:Cu/Zn superoxide dismutase